RAVLSGENQSGRPGEFLQLTVGGLESRLEIGRLFLQPVGAILNQLQSGFPIYLDELGGGGIRSPSGGLRVGGVIKQLDYLRLQRGAHSQSPSDSLDALLLRSHWPSAHEVELVSQSRKERST